MNYRYKKLQKKRKRKKNEAEEIRKIKTFSGTISLMYSLVPMYVIRKKRKLHFIENNRKIFNKSTLISSPFN